MNQDIEVKYYDTPFWEGMLASTTSYSHHHFPKHFHDHYTIQLIESGVNEGFTESNKYHISPGGVLAINPGELHAGNSWNEQPLKFHTLRIEVEYLNRFYEQHEIVLGQEVIFDHRPNYDPQIQSAMIQLITDLKYGRTNNYQEAILELFIPLLSSYSSVKPARKYSESPVSQAFDYIQDHYQEDIKLKDLAEVCHLSPYHFLRVFKQKYGLTPFQFLRNVRIERAKTLLANQSIAQTALKVGFYDHSHFLKYYKQIEGVSPSKSK